MSKITLYSHVNSQRAVDRNAIEGTIPFQLFESNNIGLL